MRHQIYLAYTKTATITQIPACAYSFGLDSGQPCMLVHVVEYIFISIV